MKHIEASIYLIKNLDQLRCKYRIYRVRGLSPDSRDYHKNAQFLVTKLSNITDSPCVLFATEEGVFIAQPDGYEELPSSLNLVRTTAKIEKEPELKELRLDSLDSVTTKLALWFLRGSIQRKFYHTPSLWQPRSGFPFYSKSPDPEFRISSDDIDLFRGFAFRVVLLPDRGIGICVDVRSKYVSRHPLPTRISHNKFNKKYRGMNCLYEYGNRWYEIKIGDLHDLNASGLKLPPNDISLFEEVHRKAGPRKSRNLLALPKDCSVLVYYNIWGEPRHAPSGLCRLTYGTDHPDVQRFHSKTIKVPHRRKRETQFVVDRYFRGLTFGSKRIRLSEKPLVVENRRFDIPDIEFGNNKVLSVRNSPGAIHVSLKRFPSKKKELLYSPEAGLFTKKQFYRQYLILPKSIYESFGKKFVDDMKNEVQKLYLGEETSYSPITVLYDDSIQRSIPALGKEIIKALEKIDAKPGYGIVMIPRIRSRRMIKEDELANLVMRELRKREIYVSIIHTTVPTESYEQVVSEDGSEDWILTSDPRQKSKYKGYLQNVVLNKILILNCCWPFVLKTPLNADLTIGIDVKNNTAGFTVIHKSGADITFYSSHSKQREQLSKSHIRTKIREIIVNQQKLSSRNIRDVVIHRQGKLFLGEKEGIIQALDKLAKIKLISPDYQCTFVEIRATSRVPFRLFEVTTYPAKQREWIENPTIGTYALISENDAFLCNTGPPYKHGGTTNPLHIVKDGPLPMESVLEDVFYLANLTWTKIDDCSRQPLSIKMNDIRLREFAGEYDRDALRFGEDE